MTHFDERAADRRLTPSMRPLPQINVTKRDAVSAAAVLLTSCHLHKESHKISTLVSPLLNIFVINLK